MVDLFDTRTMIEAVEQMPKPKTALLEYFFPKVKVFPTRYVDLDIVKGNRTMAAFVRPTSQSKLVDKLNTTMKSIEAPYTNEKSNVTAIDILNRQIGQHIYMGAKSPAQKAEEELAAQLMVLLERVTRREEWMARSLLHTGKVVLSGEYDGFEIDFGKTSSHYYDVGTDWTSDVADPYSDLSTLCLLLAKDSGISPGVAFFGQNAVAALMANANIKLYLDNRNYVLGKIDLAELPNGLTYLGTLKLRGASVECYCYNEWFVSEDDGLTYPMIDDDYVLVGSRNSANTRSYGAIQDIEYDGNGNPDAMTVANGGAPMPLQYFVKSWTTQDPSARFVKVQSAPVPCLHQPDAFGMIKVTNLA